MAPYVKSNRQYSESGSHGREARPLKIGTGPRPTTAQVVAMPDKPRVRLVNNTSEGSSSSSIVDALSSAPSSVSAPSPDNSSVAYSCPASSASLAPVSALPSASESCSSASPSCSSPSSWADYEGLDVEDWADEDLQSLGTFDGAAYVLPKTGYVCGPNDLIDLSASDDPAIYTSAPSSVRTLELGPRITPYVKLSDVDLAFLDGLMWNWRVKETGNIWH